VNYWVNFKSALTLIVDDIMEGMVHFSVLLFPADAPESL